PAQRVPERQRSRDQQKPGQEDAEDRRQGPRPASRLHSQKRRKGKKRSGQRLGGAVSGQETSGFHPARGDGFLLQQRKHDVAAPEHEGAGAVERVEHRQRCARPQAVRQRKREQQERREDQTAQGEGPGERSAFRRRSFAVRTGAARFRSDGGGGAEGQSADDPAGQDRRPLAGRRRPERDQHGG